MGVRKGAERGDSLIPDLLDLPAEAERDRESFRTFGTKSDVLIPLSVGKGQIFGLLTFAVINEERSWPESVVMGFKLIAHVFANAIERKRMDDRLQGHIQEIAELKERLERENIYLQEEIKLLVEHTNIVGQSAAMKKVLNEAEQVPKTDSTVLLLGETGTGKELLSKAIHSMSLRKAETAGDGQLCFASPHTDRKRAVSAERKVLILAH